MSEPCSAPVGQLGYALRLISYLLVPWHGGTRLGELTRFPMHRLPMELGHLGRRW